MYIYTHTYIYIYIHTYTYIYIYTYMYMHRRLLNAKSDQESKEWMPGTYKPTDPLGPRPFNTLTLGFPFDILRYREHL